jgi:hypothetical protein
MQSRRDMLKLCSLALPQVSGAVTATNGSVAFDLRSAKDLRVHQSRAAADHTLPEAKGVTI